MAISMAARSSGAVFTPPQKREGDHSEEGAVTQLLVDSLVRDIRFGCPRPKPAANGRFSGETTSTRAGSVAQAI